MEPTEVTPPKGPSSALVLGVALLVVLVLFVVGSVLVVNNVVGHLDRQECADEIEGRAWAALGDSLQAPPAPNPERLAAVEALGRAARDVGRTHELCR